MKWQSFSGAWRFKPNRMACMQGSVQVSRRTNQTYCFLQPDLSYQKVLVSVFLQNWQAWRYQERLNELCTTSWWRTISSTFSRTRKLRRFFKCSETQRTPHTWRLLPIIIWPSSILCRFSESNLSTWRFRRILKARSTRTCHSTGYLWVRFLAKTS